MAVRAFVLMNLATADLPETMNTLRTVSEVKEADPVIGPYDCIAQVESDTMEGIGRIVVDKILKIAGVAKTLTCIKI